VVSILCLVVLLVQAGKSYSGPIVAEVALDLACDGQSVEGGELVAKVVVEALDVLDQAEIPDLHDVVERLPTVLKLPGQEILKVVVGVDQLCANAIPLSGVGGFLVPAVERTQLLAGQPR